MTRRTPPALALATIAVAMLATGCTPTPEPTPTPTGFASEEEAFAAAEETYRAYVDAVNDVDVSDPTTFEPVFAFLSGNALEGTKKAYSQLHADEITMEGDSIPTSVEILSTSTVAEATLDICLDVSQVTAVDPDGNSIVSTSRPDIQPLRATLEAHEAHWRIEALSDRDDGASCE
ncbi:hypothetical protein [Microbacterium sp. bgisy189]|uniref:hypothetical protein n=1 Tax=Microbacterium sp. bgisy189 TaxID=3413798 RepID=UPI003EBE616F